MRASLSSSTPSVSCTCEGMLPTAHALLAACESEARSRATSGHQFVNPVSWQRRAEIGEPPGASAPCSCRLLTLSDPGRVNDVQLDVHSCAPYSPSNATLPRFEPQRSLSTPNDELATSALHACSPASVSRPRGLYLQRAPLLFFLRLRPCAVHGMAAAAHLLDPTCAKQRWR